MKRVKTRLTGRQLQVLQAYAMTPPRMIGGAHTLWCLKQRGLLKWVDNRHGSWHLITEAGLAAIAPYVPPPCANCRKQHRGTCQ